MKVALLTLALFWGRLHASSLDVSSSTNTLLHTGDALSFELFTWNYSANAQGLGLPIYPSDVLFSLVAAPLDTPPALAAFIESPDQSFSIAFAGPLLFTAGYLSSTSYEGPVSALTGYLHLSDSDSLNLFNSGVVTLRFLNEGEDFDLGLPLQTLRSDLFVSLSGGPLTVGALPGAVTQQSAGPPIQGVFALAAAPGASVPEPGSTVLLIGGGVLLCTISRMLGRLSRRYRGKFHHKFQ